MEIPADKKESALKDAIVIAEAYAAAGLTRQTPGQVIKNAYKAIEKILISIHQD